MFNFLDSHRWLAVTVLLNLVWMPNAISSRLEKRQDGGGLSANISGCAQSCISDAYTGNSLGCVFNDFSCLCKSDLFLSSTLACYATSCRVSDGDFASTWIAKSCASIGVNVTEFVKTATLPNGTHIFSYARNSATSAAERAKKSTGDLLAFQKTSANLLVGASLIAIVIQSI